MAMERLPIIKDTYSKNITALGYNPAKHELLVGCEGKRVVFSTSIINSTVSILYLVECSQQHEASETKFA